MTQLSDGSLAAAIVTGAFATSRDKVTLLPAGLKCFPFPNNLVSIRHFDSTTTLRFPELTPLSVVLEMAFPEDDRVLRLFPYPGRGSRLRGKRKVLYLS